MAISENMKVRERFALFVDEFAAEVRLEAIRGNRNPVEAEAIDERLSELAQRIRKLPDSLLPAYNPDKPHA